jgi:cytochrome c biogenesis protein CcdA
MIFLLALRNLAHRPWRSALLFLGYGLGVGVMIVLLAIGEALIAQASDEKLVGGGRSRCSPRGSTSR